MLLFGPLALRIVDVLKDFDVREPGFVEMNLMVADFGVCHIKF